ncbi:hypothetical protein HQ545_03075 [Candidatus Woesearchaeota archaeon]|nr:hypothetical protein [Candidatus Woesearchaeota archaeon]
MTSPIICKPSQDLLEKVEKIAKEGNPLVFLVETIAKTHIREKDSILLLLLSGLSSGLANRTNTIHTMAVGSSGKGKTAVMDSTLKVFANHQRITSSSAKSQFYKASAGLMIDNGILVFDEAENSKDAQALERVYTDMTKSNPVHETLDKKNVFKRIEMKEINAVWRNSVNTPEDDEGQLCNRYVLFNVDETPVQDRIVFKHQLNRLAFGGANSAEDKDFEIAKALISLIKKEPMDVCIPFGNQLESSDMSNRRSLPKFLNLIKSATYANRFQRMKLENYYIATIDDYLIAKLVWDKINRMESLHIRQKDQVILAVLSSERWMGVDELVSNSDINMSRSSVVRALKNMKDKGYADCQKVEGFSNKYEWTAFSKNSRVVMNLSKDDFTLDVLNRAISKLFANTSHITFQDNVNIATQQMYDKIVGNTENFEKLKSLIDKDEENSKKYEKEAKETVSINDKLVKSSEETLEVEEEYIEYD